MQSFKKIHLSTLYIFAKTDHSAQMLDIKIQYSSWLIAFNRHSALIALCNGEVKIEIEKTVPELHASRYKRPRNDF